MSRIPVRFDPNKVVECLKECRRAIEKSRCALKYGNLTLHNIQKPITKSSELMRSAFVAEVQGVSENLGAMKQMRMDQRYPDMFKNWNEIRIQRNILTHCHNHGILSGSIQWNKALEMVGKFPEVESEILKALEDFGEEKRSD